jgi:hypothetical protein
MFGKKLGIAAAIVAAILVVATAAPAGAHRSAIPGHPKAPAAVRTTPPAWLMGLRVRSEGLNRRYGLGAGALRPTGTTKPAWLVELIARSDALNRRYKLGEYAVPK